MPVELAHDVTGVGPLLVLVHGINGDRHSWDPLLEPLVAHFRVVRVDLRGHGDSPYAASYGPHDYADDVAELVEQIGGGEAPLLIGHSLGGYVATVFAARYPARGVISIDQPLDLVPMQAVVKAAEPVLRGDATPTSVETAPGPQGAKPSDVDLSWLASLSPQKRDVVLGTWSVMLDNSPQDLAAEVDRLLDGIAVPYLALHGNDPGAEYESWLAHRIPGAVVERWVGAGHALHLAEPDRFLTRVLQFAADNPAVSADTI